MENVDKNTADYANALTKATKKLTEGVEVLDAMFTYSKDDTIFDIQVAYVEGESLELFVKRDNKPMLGYRVKGKESWLYLDSEDKIRHYTDNSIIPAPTLQLAGKPAGGLIYRTGFQFVNSFDQLGQAVDAIVKRQGLGEETVMANMLTAVLRSGAVPMAARSTGSATTYTWLSPHVDEPKFSRSNYSIDSNNHFTGFEGGQYVCRMLKYGKKGSLTPSAMPKWPSKPTEDFEQPGVQEFRELMQEVLAVFGDDDAEDIAE